MKTNAMMLRTINTALVKMPEIEMAAMEMPAKDMAAARATA
jgi:hypothetical protein